MGIDNSHDGICGMGLHELEEPERHAQGSWHHSAQLQDLGRQSGLDIAQLWNVDCDLLVYMDLYWHVY